MEGEQIHTVRSIQHVGHREFVGLILLQRARLEMPRDMTITAWLEFNGSYLAGLMPEGEPLAQARLDASRNPMHTESAVVPALKARIDHGRLLADCPSCAGAELVDHEDLVFFCLSCYNQAHGGKWLTVELPPADELAAITAALLERPANQRHWRSGQSVADLQLGNILAQSAGT